ncbi:hypothetical protein VNO78_02602 [Psophocarpus tetragonolobus]|uniref:Uncharacterized protein n=1 Tax=Psophocarpus tetragonolobus TaxID=3891 RepID=A0AAN9TCB2_PSOTE
MAPSPGPIKPLTTSSLLLPRLLLLPLLYCQTLQTPPPFHCRIHCNPFLDCDTLNNHKRQAWFKCSKIISKCNALNDKKLFLFVMFTMLSLTMSPLPDSSRNNFTSSGGGPIVRPISTISPNDMQDQLLVKIPPWVKTYDFEQAICKINRSTRQPIFVEYIGKYQIKVIEFKKLSLSTLLPTENIRRYVCIIYYLSRCNQRVLSLKALKLSDSFMELYRSKNYGL